jgi:hypothetical protein
VVVFQYTADGTYNCINRQSNLLLDVPSLTGNSGIRLDQAGTTSHMRDQQFRRIEDAPPPALTPLGASQQNAAAGCR